MTNNQVTEGRYTAIPRVLIFATCDEQVLLIRRSLHKRLWPGLYNGLGGHLEQGEDALSAARRELLEESGLALPGPALWLCGTLVVDTGQNPGIAVFIFRADLPPDSAGQPPVARPSDEGALEWTPFTAVASLPTVEDMAQLLPPVLAHQRGQPPFHARSREVEGRLAVTFA